MKFDILEMALTMCVRMSVTHLNQGMASGHEAVPSRAIILQWVTSSVVSPYLRFCRVLATADTAVVMLGLHHAVGKCEDAGRVDSAGSSLFRHLFVSIPEGAHWGDIAYSAVCLSGLAIGLSRTYCFQNLEDISYVMRVMRGQSTFRLDPRREGTLQNQPKSDQEPNSHTAQNCLFQTT